MTSNRLLLLAIGGILTAAICFGAAVGIGGRTALDHLGDLGDFDFGDESVDHRPIVGGNEPCVCLVAMTGDLRMNGFLGRLIAPFVRL